MYSKFFRNIRIKPFQKTISSIFYNSFNINQQDNTILIFFFYIVIKHLLKQKFKFPFQKVSMSNLIFNTTSLFALKFVYCILG